MSRIRITQTRSEIGHAAIMRRTLRALGLRGYQRAVEVEDSPQIRGMIQRVSHLVTVEGGEGGGASETHAGEEA